MNKCERKDVKDVCLIARNAIARIDELEGKRKWKGPTEDEFIAARKDAERYRWLKKEYAEGRETYLAESNPSEKALDEYIDRQIAKTSNKTERWSGK